MPRVRDSQLIRGYYRTHRWGALNLLRPSPIEPRNKARFRHGFSRSNDGSTGTTIVFFTDAILNSCAL